MRPKIRVQGKYFNTRPDGDETRIFWGMGPDESKWDPLDFMNTTPDKVEETIAKLRNGIDL